MALITLHNGKLTAAINSENQQLVQLKLGDREYLHGGGLPASLQQEEDKLGWAQTEIVMFPVVGPSRDNKLFIEGGEHPMAQHGIVRYREWELIEQTAQLVRYHQKYVAGTPIQTSRLKDSLTWPFSFEIEKTYALLATKLVATFVIHNMSKTEMPFQLGWHPAFRLPTDDRLKTVQISCPELDLELADIQEASKTGARHVHAPEVSFETVDSGFIVRSDMGKFMLWCPAGASLLCIEPVTEFLTAGGLEQFPQHIETIKPGKAATYSVEIEILK